MIRYRQSGTPREPANPAVVSARVRRSRGFTLIEMMIVVAILGVLAAIAIPSFNKSVRRARTSEALMGLRKVFDGSVVYYDRDHTDPNGAPLAPQFPASIDWTPTVHPPRGRKAEPNPEAWEAATWQALDFAVSDPAYFVYAYLSDGLSELASFTAAASGDLDGDGLFSTFLRGGTITQNGVRGFAGIARISPLE